jgi:LexA-binding, inner membrane-associated putative hydrolase
MAGFKTHITVSTLAGVGYGAAAYAFYDVPGPACILAGGLCSVSGMLPDIDSGPGRPLRESLAFAAAVVSTMLVDRFQQFGWSMESIILAGAMVYLIIRFGVAELLKRYTVHRGMFHSIPAAIIFGEVAYLLASGDLKLRLYKAGGVVLGYMIHLVLDEMYSVYYVRGRMQLKKSFGTALKLFERRKLWPNLSTYAKLALFTFLAFQDQSWMGNFYHNRLEARTQQWTQKLVEYSGKTLGETPASSEKDAAEPAGPEVAQRQRPDAPQAAIPSRAPTGSRADQGSSSNGTPERRWSSGVR